MRSPRLAGELALWRRHPPSALYRLSRNERACVACFSVNRILAVWQVELSRGVRRHPRLTQQHGYHLSGRNMLTVGWNDHEAIGSRCGSNISRALPGHALNLYLLELPGQ